MPGVVEKHECIAGPQPSIQRPQIQGETGRNVPSAFQTCGCGTSLSLQQWSLRRGFLPAPGLASGLVLLGARGTFHVVVRP